MSFPLLSSASLEQYGREMYDLLARLFPICRSLTGDGVRQTLQILGEQIPLAIKEVPTGTQVFDWTVPEEWNIGDAYILDPNGKKIVDFKENNLHVLGYSEPVERQMNLPELKKHLYSLPDYPEAIPYLTSYYKRRWGFCMRHKDLQNLKEGLYAVKIDSTLKSGHLTYGELVLPGQEEKEVLLSCYICHPSMANDSISGVVLVTQLAKLLNQHRRRYTYRLVFIPETIGAIAFLALNKDHLLKRTHAGLVSSFVGDAGKFQYKKSRRGDAEIDRAAAHILKHSALPHIVKDFYPHLGSDERQYCSPGFNLPMGLLTRSTYMGYPQYHTSEDDLSLVSAKNLAESLSVYYEILAALEMNRTYLNQVMYCEPFLTKWNLYATIGSSKVIDAETVKLKWLLNLGDGRHDLLEIAEKMSLPMRDLAGSVEILTKASLFKPLQ